MGVTLGKSYFMLFYTFDIYLYANLYCLNVNQIYLENLYKAVKTHFKK